MLTASWANMMMPGSSTCTPCRLPATQVGLTGQWAHLCTPTWRREGGRRRERGREMRNEREGGRCNGWCRGGGWDGVREVDKVH